MMLRSLKAGGRGAVIPSTALVRGRRAWTDAAFRAALTAAALLVVVLVAWMLVQLVVAALPSIRRFGAAFLWTGRWDPVHEIFGAVTFAYGTAASSLLALLLAVPVSLGAAVYLAEIAPRAVFTTLSFVIELLASIPSVILGLWGVFVMAPWLRRVVEPALLTEVPRDLRACAAEAFAPIVVLERYADVDEAIRLADESPYGLQAGIFTNDLRIVERAVDGLEVGALIVNDANTFRVDHMPYGGAKRSGAGREGVRYAIREMTEERLLVIDAR